eukprot:255489_1
MKSMNRVNHLIGQLQPSQTNGSNEFKYTMSDKKLTKKQREFYDENGFVVVRGLLNVKDCKKYYDRFDELVANPKKGPQQMIIMRDVALEGVGLKDRKSERIVTKLQNWAYDSVFWKFAKNDDILPYV